MGREAGWHFFIKRWTMIAETVSGFVNSAQQVPQAVDQTAVLKLDIVLKKAVRARQILQQLQEFGDKQQQLELRFRPVVQQLPSLMQQLRPEELTQAAEFASSEGMREPIMQQISGSSSSCVTAAQASDPYGIRIAFRPDNPLSLLTWQQYSALISRIGIVVTQHLQGPPLEALQDFNRERKLLVHELQGLRQQLEAEVDIPQLQPLRDETERLEQLLQASGQLQDAHLYMLQRDLAKLDLDLLELKVKLKDGDTFKGSALEGALHRLKEVHKQVVTPGRDRQQQWQRRLPFAAWTKLDEDLRTLAAGLEQRQQLEQQLDVNIQKYERRMFQRLTQLQQMGSGRSSSSHGTGP